MTIGGNVNTYEKIFVIFFLVTVGIILIDLSNFFSLAIALLLILFAVAVQKMGSDKAILDISKERRQLVDILLNRLDVFQDKLSEISKHTSSIRTETDKKLVEFRHEYKVENEAQYRELAKKIFDIENKVNSVRKNLGIAYGALDERIRGFEQEDE